jgi:hypothetical protein
VHRLVRDRVVGGFSATRDLVEEESVLRQLLLGLINGGVQRPNFEENLAILRDAFLSHAAHEERSEFLLLREQVSADLLRQLAEPFSPPVPAGTSTGQRPRGRNL